MIGLGQNDEHVHELIPEGLQYHIDQRGPIVRGWIQWRNESQPVWLDVSIDHELRASYLSDLERPDLESAGLRTNAGFCFILPLGDVDPRGVLVELWERGSNTLLEEFIVTQEEFLQWPESAPSIDATISSRGVMCSVLFRPLSMFPVEISIVCNGEEVEAGVFGPQEGPFNLFLRLPRLIEFPATIDVIARWGPFSTKLAQRTFQHSRWRQSLDERSRLPIEGLNDRDVAVIASYSSRANEISTVDAMVRVFRSKGWIPIIVDASPVLREFSTSTDVLRRQNFGYDFGSWAHLLEILRAKDVVPSRLILTNDSNICFPKRFAVMLDRLDECGEGLVGVTESDQHTFHIQSYFQLWNADVLSNTRFQESFPKLGDLRNRDDAILSGELYVTQLALEAGLSVRALFRPHAKRKRSRNSRVASNPMHTFSKDLWRQGSPFIKKELIRYGELDLEMVNVLRRWSRRDEAVCRQLLEMGVNRFNRSLE